MICFSEGAVYSDGRIGSPLVERDGRNIADGRVGALVKKGEVWMKKNHLGLPLLLL